MGRLLPRGRHRRAVQSLVTLFVELGGEIRLNSPVRKIRLETCKHGSRSPHGTVHRVTTDHLVDEAFDLVVSNADLHHTYSQLYSDVPAAARDDTEVRANGLVDVTVRDVLRNESALRTARASHDSVWPSIQGAAA